MSTSLHNDRSAHGIQPKLKDCTYDQAKNAADLMVWLTLVSGVVSTHREDMSATKWWSTPRAPLENFLDHHLDQQKGHVLMQPAFLNDPDLQLPGMPMIPM